jgi:hypothetical protein
MQPFIVVYWTPSRFTLHEHTAPCSTRMLAATGRVWLIPSQHLSLSPLIHCGLHDPCRGEGGRSACVLTSTLASWWGVEGGPTRAPSPERAQGFRWEADAPSCTPSLHSSPHPLSLHSPTTPQQRHHPPAPQHPPPSAGGGCHRAAQHCTHGLTVPNQ